jgi:hypothetical protein
LVVYINSSNLRKENFYAVQRELNDEGRRAGESSTYFVLKLFQDVNTRWDSICHMLIRALKLRHALDRYHAKHEAEYLQLSSTEWSQVEYLIDLTKVFCVFIKLIGQSKQPTIHHVFDIYNKLFDHLEQARARLSRKRMSWKRALMLGIEAADNKLRQYYARTQGSLGHLYGKAALLSLNKKDVIFKSSNWAVSSFESTWEDVYWEKLDEHYDLEYRDIVSSHVSARNVAIIRDVNDLDLLLSSNVQGFFFEEGDELRCYRKRGMLMSLRKYMIM